MQIKFSFLMKKIFFEGANVVKILFYTPQYFYHFIAHRTPIFDTITAG